MSARHRLDQLATVTDRQLFGEAMVGVQCRDCLLAVMVKAGVGLIEDIAMTSAVAQICQRPCAGRLPELIP